jgi:hypothetical protein
MTDPDLRRFFTASRAAEKARRRGDLPAADYWLRIAERELRIARLFDRVMDEAEGREQRAHAPTTHSGPVMLDPKGFSPGGTPNWVLNRRRLERAGK